MAATTSAFIFFNRFKEYLGTGKVDLSLASHFWAELHSSATTGLTANSATISTIGSLVGTSDGVEGSAGRSVANAAWTAFSAAPNSQYAWDSDAIVWTATSDANMTVKFAIFYASALAGDSILPIGYIQLVASDQVVTAGNTVTLTPNTVWFRMSG